MKQTFDSLGATQLNKARLDHLASLGLDLECRSVLEPGAGVGHLTHFWEERKCEIVSTDVSLNNVKTHLDRHPHRSVYLADLDQWGEHKGCGRFNIVFLYGTLYHLARPAQAIAELAPLCDLFLLETCVYHKDDGELHSYTQWPGLDQGPSGIAYVPARNWIMRELGKHLEHVYCTRTQPDSVEFPRSWPGPSTHLTRSVFVASRDRLDLPTLTKKLPRKQ